MLKGDFSSLLCIYFINITEIKQNCKSVNILYFFYYNYYGDNAIAV